MTAIGIDSLVLPDGHIWQVLAERRCLDRNPAARHRDRMDYVALPARHGRRRGVLVMRRGAVAIDVEVEQQLDRSWRVLGSRLPEGWVVDAARAELYDALGTNGGLVTGITMSPDGCSLFVNIDRPARRRWYTLAVRRVDGRPVTSLPSLAPQVVRQCA